MGVFHYFPHTSRANERVSALPVLCPLKKNLKRYPFIHQQDSARITRLAEDPEVPPNLYARHHHHEQITAMPLTLKHTGLLLVWDILKRRIRDSEYTRILIVYSRWLRPERKGC